VSKTKQTADVGDAILSLGANGVPFT